MSDKFETKFRDLYSKLGISIGPSDHDLYCPMAISSAVRVFEKMFKEIMESREQLKETQEQLEEERAINKETDRLTKEAAKLLGNDASEPTLCGVVIDLKVQLEALKAKNEKLMAKIHEQADLFEADGDLIRKLTDDIESLKADKAKVEAEAINKILDFIQGHQEIEYDAGAKRKRLDSVTLFNFIAAEFEDSLNASQLETKEKPE